MWCPVGGDVTQRGLRALVQAHRSGIPFIDPDSGFLKLDGGIAQGGADRSSRSDFPLLCFGDAQRTHDFVHTTLCHIVTLLHRGILTLQDSDLFEQPIALCG